MVQFDWVRQQKPGKSPESELARLEQIARRAGSVAQARDLLAGEDLIYAYHVLCRVYGKQAVYKELLVERNSR